MRGRAPLRAAAASVLAMSVLPLAGRGGEAGSHAPTAGANDFGCLSPEQAKTGYVTFTSSEGQDAEAFATGKGTTALVLAHQADGDVCRWVPDAVEPAEDGYRVIAVDSAGSEVAESTAAVAHARVKGAHKVLLVGASKGGTARAGLGRLDRTAGRRGGR
ncbi:hypothetical protein OG900_19900 [Streptomyces sp. NBC_00433]